MASQPPLAEILDYVGRNERRRKVRLIRRDTREPGGRTSWSHNDVLLQGRGFTLARQALRVGDYGWDLRPESALYQLGFRDYLVERKTLSDLRDVERLQSQLHRAYTIMEAGGRSFFVVLIDYTDDGDMGRAWTDEALLNAELSIQIGGHFKVTRCDSGLLAARIESLYNHSQKPRHSLGS